LIKIFLKEKIRVWCITHKGFGSKPSIAPRLAEHVFEKTKLWKKINTKTKNKMENFMTNEKF
jgi:hypothetical protein